MKARIKKWLAHPLTRGMELDDPQTTTLRRQIIQDKRFLRAIYDDWYTQLAEALPDEPGAIVELGSGAGFFNDYVPDAILTDVMHCEGIDFVMDAHRLPFDDQTLQGIVMVDVFHHLSDVELFLREASRCVVPGGTIAMVEPWLSSWSKLIYKNLHHEAFDDSAADWPFPSHGPLSDANGALPWIVFERDINQFRETFPEWRIETIKPHTPLRYLLSGGVSMRSLLPDSAYGVVDTVERWLDPKIEKTAMFATIVLTRQ